VLSGCVEFCSIYVDFNFGVTSIGTQCIYNTSVKEAYLSVSHGFDNGCFAQQSDGRASVTGAVPANQPVSGGEATDRRKSFRRKMADCPS